MDQYGLSTLEEGFDDINQLAQICNQVNTSISTVSNSFRQNNIPKTSPSQNVPQQTNQLPIDDDGSSSEENQQSDSNQTAEPITSSAIVPVPENGPASQFNENEEFVDQLIRDRVQNTRGSFRGRGRGRGRGGRGGGRGNGNGNFSRDLMSTQDVDQLTSLTSSIVNGAQANRQPQQAGGRYKDTLIWKYIGLYETIKNKTDQDEYATSCSENELAEDEKRRGIKPCDDQKSKYKKSGNKKRKTNCESDDSCDSQGEDKFDDETNHSGKRKKVVKHHIGQSSSHISINPDDDERDSSSHGNNSADEYPATIGGHEIYNTPSFIKDGILYRDNGGDGGDGDMSGDEEFIEYSNKKSKKRCFACSRGERNQDAINGTKMNACIRIIQEEYGYNDNNELARIVHLYFKHEIYFPMRLNNMKIDMWRTSEILVHIEKHLSLEPHIFIGESIKLWKELWIQIMLNYTIKEEVLTDGTMRRVPDKDSIKSAIDIYNVVLKTYKERPQNMNFYNENFTIDFEKIGKSFNVHRNWVNLPKGKNN